MNGPHDKNHVEDPGRHHELDEPHVVVVKLVRELHKLGRECVRKLHAPARRCSGLRCGSRGGIPANRRRTYSSVERNRARGTTFLERIPSGGTKKRCRSILRQCNWNGHLYVFDGTAGGMASLFAILPKFSGHLGFLLATISTSDSKD